jgi:hypothetical protein
VPLHVEISFVEQALPNMPFRASHDAVILQLLRPGENTRLLGDDVASPRARNVANLTKPDYVSWAK